MRSLYMILVVLTMVVLCSGLRTIKDFTPAYYSPQTYQRSLDDIQTKFQNQLKSLNNQINEINQVIHDSNQTTSIKVTTLTEKMADQRNSLYNVQQILKVPYSLKICQCRQLAAIEKQRMQDKIFQIKTNISTLQQELSQCSGNTCQNYKYIQQQVKNMKSYLQSVQQIVNSDCCHNKLQFKQQKAQGMVDVGSSVLYKDNLKAKNWYYGSTNQHDYRMQMFQLTTKYNISTCPLTRPFANFAKNRCEKCKDEGAVFNLGVRSCFYCGKLAYLNQSNSLCDPCPQNQFYNYTQKKCKNCAPDSFLNKTSQKCQPCPKGQFFDSNSNQCVTCPDNNQYDRAKQVCKPCNVSAAQYLDNQTKACKSCPNGLLYNINSNKCEACQGNMYYNKISANCVPCQLNHIFNQTSLKCQLCPSDSYFNQTMGRCVKCPNGARFDNVVQQCIQVAINNTNTTNTTNTTGKCTSTTPFYNTYTKKCEKCAANKVYDQLLKQCVKNNNIGICPPDRPFYDISIHNCVACPQGTTFNTASYQCESSNHRHTLQI